jgi:two-component sensor histidine kinase
LTRVSIHLQKTLLKTMDGRVKPGHDGFVTVPALRSGMKNAAPRPGHTFALLSQCPEPEIARTAAKQRDTKGRQPKGKSSGAMQAMAGPTIPEDFLKAENVGLRMLLEQAGIDARTLLAQAGIDAKEREAADKLQKLILEELHHRIKNTLATVSAIAAQSLRTATSLEHGQHAIESRLLALGRAHDLLLQARWASASLAHIVQGATEPYDSQGAGKFSIKGPDLQISSGAVIALAMTLNELCTNTTKFGALSVPAGRIEIAWSIDEPGQRLRLGWSEKDGPPVQAPTRRSFGTRMIETLGKQLSGEVSLTYAPAGFVYTLDVPLSALKPPV